MEDTSLFAKNLRFLIKSKDINNSKLERDMGWGKNSVHNYVTGNNEPNYDRTIVNKKSTMAKQLISKDVSMFIALEEPQV